ncbi:MAG: phage scaffolding protein [Coriobacteriales bacterium]
MAEETGQQQEPQSEPKGGPDLTEANKRLTGENAALKEQLQAMQKQRDELDAKLGKALTQEDVAAAVKAANDEAKKAYEGEKAKWAASNKKLAVQGSLAQAGCIDAAALMAHVDMEGVDIAPDGHISGLDVAKLQEAYPYLFKAQPEPAAGNTVPSAQQPAGAAKKMTKEEIVAIKDPAKRRRAIAENHELFGF